MKKILFLTLASLITCSSFAQVNLVREVKKETGKLIIPFKQYELPNGLTVILHEDHSDPVVHVDVTYHVGSAREEIGKSGFAHFFEHMMFQGSDNVADEQHFKIITESGGTLNGTTNKDRTNYFETVPANQLEKMLWLEADRMGFLLDAVTQKKFEVQRATVKNERGQNYDNRPYGLAGETMSKNLYPYGHPYSWLTIGYVEDLNRVDVNDLKNFFLRWYGPNNAVLTIGGDINEEETLQWVQKYYGSIPRGPEVNPVKVPPAVIKKDRYVSLIDNYARTPMLVATLPTVPRYHPDEVALDCLANIIGGGKSSVLYQNVVKTQKGRMARASHPCFELAGEFSFRLMPKPGTSLAEMEKELRLAIAQVAKEGIDAKDVARYRKSTESRTVYGLESVRGKVSQLASYQTFTGDANYLPKDMKRNSGITKDDVLRVFNKYIKDKPMVILSVLPKGKEILQAKEPNYEVSKKGYNRPNYGYDKLKYTKAKDNFDRTKQPKAGDAISVKVPKVERFTKKTKNGEAKMITSFSDEIPVIALRISMKGGRLAEQNDLTKAGLASMFSSMMNEHTKKMSAEVISDKLSEMGSSVGVGTSLDRVNFTVRTLKKNLAETLNILRARMYEPDFKQKTFDRIKNQRIQSIKNSKTRARTIASQAYAKVNYGLESVLGNPSSGRLATVQNIQLVDIEEYYNDYIGANDLQIVLVGDFNEEDKMMILGVIEDLKPTSPKFKPLPPVRKNPKGKIIYAVDIPKAAQTEFRVGYVTDMKYDTKGDYYQSNLMNYPLGGAFNSRVNLNLREDKGWTYGARARFSANDYTGSYTFSSGIKADKTVDALKEVLKEFDGYQNRGIKKDELTFLKNAISLSDARKYETAFQKLGFLSNMLNRDLEVSYVDEQNKVLDKISSKKINQLAKKWIDKDKMNIVLTGDISKFEAELTKMGYQIIKVNSQE